MTERPTNPDSLKPTPPRPRAGSSPRLVVLEEVGDRAIREPTGGPHPPPKRARVNTLQHSPAPPPNWREEVTGRGIPHPLSDHPPAQSNRPPEELWPEEDTKTRLDRERVIESVRARDAEAEASGARREIEKLQRELAESLKAQLELQQTKPPSLPPKPPSFSLSFGSAKWWAAVGAAVVGVLHGVPPAVKSIREWAETPTHAQLEAFAAQVKDQAEAIKARGEIDDRRDRDNQARWRIQEAVICQQGVTAPGLDCEAARKRVPFQQQPLNPRVRGSGPQWSTNESWPPARPPPE